MRAQLHLTTEPPALKAQCFILGLLVCVTGIMSYRVASVVSFVPLTATQACFRVTVPVCIELL